MCRLLPHVLAEFYDYFWPIARIMPLPVLLAGAGTQTGPASEVNVLLSENHPWIAVDFEE